MEPELTIHAGTTDPEALDGARTRTDAGRGRRTRPTIRPGAVGFGVAFGIAAATAFAWPGLTSGLEADGVADPDAIIQTIGSVTLLTAAAMLGIAGYRSEGRRRVGQITVALGALLLAIGTATLLGDPSRTIGVVRTHDGITPVQTIGFALLVLGVLAMPSSLRWNRIAVIDGTLAATTVVALTWLAPLRQTGVSAVSPIDIVERHPGAVLLLALMTAGVLLLVRVAQASRPGDLAIVVSALLVPSAAYCSMIGELAGRTSVPIRTAMMWWLCGPAILAVAGFQSLRSGPEVPDDPDAAALDDVGRAARSEWVASLAVGLSLGAVATHKLFIQSLDPMMLAVGLVTVALSIARLALLQQRQMALQRRLEALAVELHDRARTDELTGLGNRIALMEELERCLTTGERISAFYADVDDFKTVNDALGHETGDRLLVRTAERLVDTIGPSTFRIGGDEFVALRRDLDDASAGALARTIVALSTEPVEVDDVSVSARLSIGVASADQGTRTGDQLLRDADLALNRAKELGRCRAATFDLWLQDRADRRLEVQRGLRDAVASDDFITRYRPVVDLDSGAIVGAEAVTRWEGPNHRRLSPDEYFEIAGDAGLVPAISRSTLRAAAAPWITGAPPAIPLSITFTRHELRNGGFVEDLDALVGDVPRSAIRLRIPESALSDPSARATIDHVVDRRYAICVRDFGTAASSWRHLTRLSDPSICVDRSFVAGLGHRSADRMVLGSIVKVGKQLGVRVSVDGVTRPGQATMLRALGIEVAQGWLFGRPVDWSTFAQRLTAPSGEHSGLSWRPAAGSATAEVNR